MESGEGGAGLFFFRFLLLEAAKFGIFGGLALDPSLDSGFFAGALWVDKTAYLVSGLQELPFDLLSFGC